MSATDKYIDELKRQSLSQETSDIIRSHAVHMEQVRKLFDWCNCYSDEMFNEYVLPMRVNDEPVALCSPMLTEALLPIIKDLSMLDAAVAVNYFCMSQVAYRFNDAPTADVLSIWNRGHGRCGEESTFAVMAYRSVGIPARQVYAKLWSHCDDNHAWVEIFVDGKWHYLGACEAEPRLNVGWFSGPSALAMLIRGYSYSNSNTINHGGEICGKEDDRYIVNVTERYADCKLIRFHAVKGGIRVPHAVISVQIANYGCFSDAVRLKCDEKGTAALSLGLGTAYLYAGVSAEEFCFIEFDTRIVNEVTVDLDDTIADGVYFYSQAVPQGSIPNEPYCYSSDDYARADKAKTAYFRRIAALPVEPRWEYPTPTAMSGDCSLTLLSDSVLEYAKNIVIERLEQNGFSKVDLRNESLQEIALPHGRYRINAFRRQIDGRLCLNTYVIRLESGCKKILKVVIPDFGYNDLLSSYALEAPYSNVDLGMICFYDEKSEPFLHVEREFEDLRSSCPDTQIHTSTIKVLCSDTVTTNMLLRMRQALNIFDARLPLTIAVKGGHAVFGFSGYNVGMINVLAQLLFWED